MNSKHLTDTCPNIILINCDDMGYGDLSCYGSKVNRTPNLDRMADEGLRLTDFYMASPVCSPSRGAMLTGCYPNRIGFDGFDGEWVLFPGQSVGLNPEENTIASLLKKHGYSTKLIGKWHCGDQPEFLPTRHGFDSYYGLPYSNDMGRQAGDRREWVERLQKNSGISYRGPGSKVLDDNYPPLPLLRNEEVIQEQPDQASLTERYVEEAVRFIREKKDGPFFLYFAHMYVHLPIYTPARFLNRSKNGRYGAAVEHTDWSVAVILDELKRQGIDENTLVVFTSDNGSRARGEGGSNGPLRGRKGQTFEGGMRLPCIMRWPGRIKPGITSGELVSSIDFLPTFLALAGGSVPDDKKIDGLDISEVLSGGKSPRNEFFYFHKGDLCAVRRGKWKLHVSRDGEAVKELYDLEADTGETANLFDDEPGLVAELKEAINAAREELGDTFSAVEGKGVRPIGRVENPAVLTTFREDHPYFAAEYDLSDAG